MEKVNFEEKFPLFNDYWSPKIVGELNGQLVKFAKFKDEFVWHKHDEEDELFFVLKGTLDIAFRDKTVTLQPNEFMIVPKGVEHKPIAKEEVWVMLFESASTLNTGNTVGELTKRDLDRL
ncbi:mannose-6-phosphate isomerase-like protein (cupin superfamily) [Chitinophaga skermanii]|uniref:Mannose-6-phosphate isomerase-like protein (Cupin superfamily) n=1 Tax=Chitinophaga skermanii TaxID=331697 RepID=A0A327QPF7_9BACT|nr:cupin domain-containing protein [Chitinophaga skermanii]RAJ06469.1 mannose-6-phosphate isomerase-like protein (cupin superfamily) [Chitinophaga skermanii]